ncbi:hypothetical protein HYW21_03095 [Candidatus Woesearchaeota archaeon]|nr:hypothetical protein [Candidatus Woesearchaeota archaeon]
MSNKEQHYKTLQKKYKLPLYKELDEEFEINDIETERSLLGEIRKKIIDRIDPYLDILDKILQPDQVFTELYEAKNFDEEEKKEMYVLYRRLMWYLRYATEVSVTNTEKENALFINLFWKEWPALKKKIAPIMKKVKEGWQLESEAQERLAYFG